MGHLTRTAVPMPTNARVHMPTGSSRAASGTTCRKKRRRRLSKRSSRSTGMERRWLVEALRPVARGSQGRK